MLSQVIKYAFYIIQMGSNTAFLGEKPIRKTFFHTTYGKKFCTQFSPDNDDGKSNAEEISVTQFGNFLCE